jgi:hypothetical protein
MGFIDIFRSPHRQYFYPAVSPFKILKSFNCGESFSFPAVLNQNNHVFKNKHIRHYRYRYNRDYVKLNLHITRASAIFAG